MPFTFEDLRELDEGGSITAADWNRARQNFQAIVAGDEQVGDAGTLDGAAKSTDGTFADNSDAKVPTEKAVKTYVSNNTVSADDYSCLFYPSYENLTAKPNTSNPNYQVDIAWDELRIENRRTTSKSFTVDITASGALGLDTGSEAVSTWYYIWAICNDAGTTVSAIFSASATSPTLPSGYTKSRLISAVYNMADGHFRGFQQLNNDCYNLTKVNVITSGMSSSFVDVSLATAIPDGIYRIHTYCGIGTNTSSIASINGYLDGIATLQHEKYVYGSSSGSSSPIIISDNQKLQYKINTGTPNNVTIDVYGFEINL